MIQRALFVRRSIGLTNLTSRSMSVRAQGMSQEMHSDIKGGKEC